jgi:hypothetical protein
VAVAAEPVLQGKAMQAATLAEMQQQATKKLELVAEAQAAVVVVRQLELKQETEALGFHLQSLERL